MACLDGTKECSLSNLQGGYKKIASFGIRHELGAERQISFLSIRSSVINELKFLLLPIISGQGGITPLSLNGYIGYQGLPQSFPIMTFITESLGHTV